MSGKRAKQLDLKEFEFVVEFDQSDIARMQTIASRIVFSIISKEFDYWNPEKITAVIEEFLAFLERDVLGESTTHTGEAEIQEPEDIITTQASFLIIQDLAIQIIISLNEKIGSFLDWVLKQNASATPSGNTDESKLQLMRTTDLPLNPESFDFKIEEYYIWVHQYALCSLGNNVWAIYPWIL